MTWTVVCPGWVVPSPCEVDDAHWLAYRAYVHSGSVAVGGVCSALAWVRGAGFGPVTGRDEQPVTEALARAEMWAASAAERIVDIPPPVESIYVGLGVAYWPAGEVDPGWATGVRAVLRWLYGTPGQKPPIEVPVRLVDGTTPTAEELYDVAVRVTPYLYELPERQVELWRRVEANARRYRQLAAQIEDIKRRVNVAS